MAAMRRNSSGRFGCCCCAVLLLLLLLLVVLCCCVRRSDAFRFGRRHESETEKALPGVWNSWDFREPRTNSLNSAFPFNDGLLMMDAYGATPTNGRQKRYIGQFGDMIRLITGREPLLYNAYGNYCGLGGDSELKPVDDTDACCKRHDDCYGDAEAGECRNEWLQPKWIYYDWQAVELVPPAVLLPFGVDEEAEDEEGNKNNDDDDDDDAAAAAAPDHRVLNHDGPREENATAAVTNDGETALEHAFEKFVSGDPPAQTHDDNKSRRKRQPSRKIQAEDDPRIELERIRRSSDGRQVIMCGLSNDDCRRAVCECDRIAAECFAATDYDVKHKRSSILDLFVPQNRDPRFPNSVHARSTVELSADP